MSRKLTPDDDARIRKIRDTEGLRWSTIGERFQVSGGCARAGYMRAAAPTYPKRWRTAATRLGIGADEYARRREANERLCGRCDRWFDEDSDEYNAARWACFACLKRDDGARSTLTSAQREARKAATDKRRRDKTAAQMRRLDDQLLATIKGNAQTLGPRFRVAALEALVSSSGVTIRARLRRLEARGVVSHTADGWGLG